MVAWVPMTRLDDNAEVQAWQKKASGFFDDYFSQLKAEAEANLDRKRKELGSHHPLVQELERSVAEFVNSEQ